jgi:hypothetical protein
VAKKPFFSEREVRLARSFIKAIKGNESNGYLLLAVVAWQRAMTKSHDAFFKSLTKYSSVSAGRLLAQRLLRKGQLTPKQFKGVIAALRRNVGTAAKNAAAQVEQARDFMLGIEQSNWDPKHYGYVAFEEAHWGSKKVWHALGATPGYGYWETQMVWVPEVQEVDPLAMIWSGLTGHNIPKQYFVDKAGAVIQPKPVVTKEPPRQPRSLAHVLPKPDYIGPYAARTFYEARPHLGANVLEDF